MSAHKLHVQQRDVSSFHFYHSTLNQACSAAWSLNASLQCAWNSLLQSCLLVHTLVFPQTHAEDWLFYERKPRRMQSVRFGSILGSSGQDVKSTDVSRMLWSVLCGTGWPALASSAETHGCCGVAHWFLYTFLAAWRPQSCSVPHDVSCQLDTEWQQAVVGHGSSEWSGEEIPTVFLLFPVSSYAL